MCADGIAAGNAAPEHDVDAGKDLPRKIICRGSLDSQAIDQRIVWGIQGRGSTLTGIDVDSEAVEIAGQNARVLGLAARARFECINLWSEATNESLRSSRPHLLICNPPYIPEPPGLPLELEAGAGPNGTAHLLRTIDLAAETNPRAMALSWCSLSDPVGIVEAAAATGYALNSLFIVCDRRWRVFGVSSFVPQDPPLARG